MADADPGEAFLAALTSEARARFVEPTGAVLAAHLEAARAAYPAIVLADDRFAAELARRLGEHASPERLASVRAPHVFLAIASVDGDEAAIRELDRELAREAEQCAGRLRALPDQAIEARGHLRRILFVSEPGRPAAIGAYAGKGDLRSYLRVIATRELIRIINKGRREIGVEDEVLERLSPSTDPELVYLRDHYRADVDAALRAALGGLAAEARALLRYHLLDGWSIDRIGALYGVHRATAARWLTTARQQLGVAIRADLAARLAIPDEEVESIVRLVQSRIDVSLARLLDPP